MTKRELLARLVHDPVVIERVSNLSHYRIAPHGDPDPTSGVWIALVPVPGAPLAEDPRQVYARMNGRTVRLTSRETEEIVARLGRLFVRGGPRGGKGSRFFETES
jgi:hypothetical protein